MIGGARPLPAPPLSPPLLAIDAGCRLEVVRRNDSWKELLYWPSRPDKACWPCHSGIYASWSLLRKKVSADLQLVHILFITFSAAAVHGDMQDYPGFL